MPLNIVSEMFMEWCLVKGGRHTGIFFANMSFAEKSADLQLRSRSITVY